MMAECVGQDGYVRYPQLVEQWFSFECVAARCGCCCARAFVCACLCLFVCLFVVCCTCCVYVCIRCECVSRLRGATLSSRARALTRVATRSR